VTVQRHERAIIDLASQSDGADDFKRGGDVKEEAFDRVETGIREFDEVAGGLPCGTLTYLAGRPGMGKTALAVTLLRNVAKRGHASAINSLEMPSTSLINRAAAAEAYDERLEGNLQYSDYERRILHGEAQERFEAAKARIKRLPIWWDDKEGRSAPQIRMGGRRLKTATRRDGFDLRLLVIDHIGHIAGHTNKDSRAAELGDISKELLATSKELKIPVVVLAQLNRELEKRPDKRPNVWDLRESGRLEEDGHTVLLLYRQEHYDNMARQRGEEVDEEKALEHKNIVEIDFAKNRGGILKRIRLFCDIGSNAIMDRSVGFATKMRPIQEGLFS
jgi:replicative DNA helicase